MKHRVLQGFATAYQVSDQETIDDLLATFPSLELKPTNCIRIADLDLQRVIACRR